MSDLPDPRDLAKRLLESASEYADKNAAARALEETKGTILGKLVKKYLALDPKGSITRAEHFAKADPDYEDHIRRMVEAEKESIKAKARWDTGKVFIDLVRSKEATAREEMKLR